jgi:hypothetical protein
MQNRLSQAFIVVLNKGGEQTPTVVHSRTAHRPAKESSYGRRTDVFDWSSVQVGKPVTSFLYT